MRISLRSRRALWRRGSRVMFCRRGVFYRGVVSERRRRCLVIRATSVAFDAARSEWPRVVRWGRLSGRRPHFFTAAPRQVWCWMNACGECGFWNVHGAACPRRRTERSQ